jgi:hypothetical protein
MSGLWVDVVILDEYGSEECDWRWEVEYGSITSVCVGDPSLSADYVDQRCSCG